MAATLEKSEQRATARYAIMLSLPWEWRNEGKVLGHAYVQCKHLILTGATAKLLVPSPSYRNSCMPILSVAAELYRAHH